MRYSNVFDSYKFGETLGQGQFGQVKKAIQLSSGSKVAVKLVKKKHMSGVDVF